MSSLRIGRCGELLVQYQLLRLGIESAPMTTDSGIDLVAFNGGTKVVRTIQVKTCDAPKPGGGKGKLALDWWMSADCPADLVAFADLSTDSVWLFEMSEMGDIAQQHSNGRYHFYMYIDATVRPRVAKPARQSDFDSFRLRWRVPHVFDAR